MSSASRILLRLAAWSAAALPGWFKRALYQLGPLTRFVRRSLNRAAPTGLRVLSVAGGPLRGARIALDLQAEKALWLGTYEPSLEQAIGRLIRPGLVAYDIGANIGYTTLLLARAVTSSGRVVAFEPLPANFKRLTENLALNPEGEWVEAVLAAVGDREGKAQFLVHASGTMGKVSGSSGREALYEREITAELVTIDDFVLARGWPAPNLVKVDVEGGERAVLEGMWGVLSKHRPILLLELHGHQASRDCFEILEQAGYRMRLLQPERVIVDPSELPWKALIQAEWAEV